MQQQQQGRRSSGRSCESGMSGHLTACEGVSEGGSERQGEAACKSADSPEAADRK